MKTCEMPANGGSGQRGIALVVVLGFLSVLVIMAVGFAVAMRTERMAAKNFADVVRARQHVQTGLARTINEIDEFMAAPPALLYPPWQVFATTTTPFLVGPADLISGSATSFVPYSLQGTAYGGVSSMSWIAISDPIDGKLRGRYATIALNCSGLLDANTIGVDHEEITNENIYVDVATNLAEFGALSVVTFTNRRAKTWVRLESLPEMRQLATNLLGSNVFVFSRFPPDKRRDKSTGNWFDQVDIGLDETQLPAQKTNITKLLDTEGLVPGVDAVFENLLDYVDANDTPHNLNSFDTEAVPMINEIAVTNRLIKIDKGGGVIEYTHDLILYVETWYPFPGTKSVTVVGPSTISYTGPSQPVALLPLVTDLITPQPVSVNHDAYSFRRSQFTYRRIVATTNAGYNAIGFQLKLDGDMQIKVDNAVVDQVNLKDLPNQTFQITLGNVAGQGFGAGSARGGVMQAASVADPRYNHLIKSSSGENGGWAQDNPASLEAPYTNQRAYTVAASAEGISEMYVRNGPLHSVAELGFLTLGQPWRTVALYDPPGTNAMNPVLDQFRIGPLPTNSARGKVNINTTNLIALAAPLLRTPIERYPDEMLNAQVYHIDPADAADIADDIEQMRATIQNVNVSVIGLATNAYSANGNLMIQLATDAKKESLIRNVYEYYSIRQNLFTIFVVAQDVNDFNGDNSVQNTEITAEQRAVAVVWRDPLPNANGHNVSYVRFFKWLTE